METGQKLIRVLLADDHAIIRDGLKQIFSDTDDIFVTGEAANATATMEQVRHADFDVAVLDISMPGRSGLELVRQLKAEKPELSILILSMHQEEQYAVRALHSGAAGYLTKEADADVLVEAVRRVAAGGVYMSEKVARMMVRSVQPDAKVPPHTLLSDREYQIFDMLVRGMGVTEIAQALSLSVKTISTHKTHILQKMDLETTADLVRYAVAHDLMLPE